MKKKVIAALGLIAVLILMFVSKIWTPYVFDVCMGFAIIVASMETSKLMLKMGMYNYVVLAGLFPSILYLVSLVLILKEVNVIIVFASLIIAIVGLTLLTFIASLIFKKWLKADMQIRKIPYKYSNFAFRKTIYTMATFVYPTLFLIFILFINHMTDFGYFLTAVNNFYDINLSLILLFVTFLIPIVTDSFAMFSGMAFKGPKLCPKASPNKTISGFVGGVVMSTLIMIALYYVLTAFNTVSIAFAETGINLIHFATMGFFGAIISSIGDIFESIFKRKALVKDSGNFIPGHGGMLDRIDSHVFNAPFIFFYFFILLL